MPAVFLLRRCASSLQKAQDLLTGSGMADWSVCGSAMRLRETREALAGCAPDIIACDLSLLDGRALQLAQSLRGLPRRPQLLLLAPMADELALFEALRLGANGYCIDADRGVNLLLDLRKLDAGRATMSPAIARQILDAYGLGRSSLDEALAPEASQDVTPMAHGLPRAEQHLLSLLAHGLLGVEIAARWDMTPADVERRLWRVYPRLHRLGVCAAGHVARAGASCGAS
ncbi:hypothetical protein [Roseateles violae]|uniref:DNA-binding NarL/FixJ family response regulator n=1 Tax=Roseateles violae TaxID=3058042 RepID=A0ABT8DKB8_9BURK|nr:hypothetical protein [Pelomonas sp. PFR6]MDN3918837.1 hypothetical protein [Pelomonas sp. PFR6]